MRARLPGRALVDEDEVSYRSLAVAYDVREVTEGQADDPACLRAGQTNVEDAGLALPGDPLLQHQGGAFGKDRDIGEKLRLRSDEPHAVALPADIRLGDQREDQPRLPGKRQGAAPILRGISTASPRQRRVPREPAPLVPRDHVEINGLQLAPEPAPLDQRIDEGRQGDAAVSEGESYPLDRQRQVEGLLRNALRPPDPGGEAAQRRHAPVTCFRRLCRGRARTKRPRSPERPTRSSMPMADRASSRRSRSAAGSPLSKPSIPPAKEHPRRTE